MAKAQEKLKGADEAKGKGKKGGAKTRGKSPAKKSPVQKKKTPASDGKEKKSLEEQREALREAKRLEKQVSRHINCYDLQKIIHSVIFPYELPR